MTPQEMMDLGYGTGHPMDMGAHQVLIDDVPHNVLRKFNATLAAAPTHGIPDFGTPIGVPLDLTLCGLRITSEHEPYQSGPTKCDRCATLAAHSVIAS